MKRKLIASLLNCFVAFFFFFFTFKVYAADLKNTYDSLFELSLDGSAHVVLNILIENLDPSTYINKYTMSLPKSYDIRNLKASNKFGTLKSSIDSVDKLRQVKVLFGDYGQRTTSSSFTLEFNQANLFKTSGASWEIILPTFEDTSNKTYNVTVILPQDPEGKKLSIAKPKPTSLSGNKIIWENVQTKTVYAVFGPSQYYKLDLNYTLKNDESAAVYYEVAFPPETSYQNIIVSEIVPLPEKVYLDEDGNYLGRYTLAKNTSKKIQFSGFAKVLVSPDEEILNFVRKNIIAQKSYLLTEQKYWKLGSWGENQDLKNLKSPRQIYDFVKKRLKYDYLKLGPKNMRVGAAEALKNPSFAVCMEFTDVFLAIAREKGILAREIEGFGFSSDDYLRPLSLTGDVLHSWPEYYDQTAGTWIEVDPTWEATAGMNYFDSFDLNHLTLAIHGKDSTYPVGAGMYKDEPSTKDVNVKPVKYLPARVRKITLTDNIKSHIVEGQKNKAKITVTNSGNYFLKNLKISLKSDNIDIKPALTSIDLLAPLETRNFEVEYRAEKQVKKGEIQYFVDNEKNKTQEIKVDSIFFAALKQILLIFFIITVILLIKKIRNKVKNA